MTAIRGVTGTVLIDRDGLSLRETAEAAAHKFIDLSGANLRYANLSYVNLSGAELNLADLSGADLNGAWLRSANLSGADLTGADLTGADLTDACLRQVNAVIDAGCPDGWPAFGWLRDGVRVKVGCRDFSLEEGRDYWRGKAHRREITAALDYIEVIARIRGWIK